MEKLLKVLFKSIRSTILNHRYEITEVVLITDQRTISNRTAQDFQSKTGMLLSQQLSQPHHMAQVVVDYSWLKLNLMILILMIPQLKVKYMIKLGQIWEISIRYCLQCRMNAIA